MRLSLLQLLAFGPFRGLELDFSAPGLHVVFGRNEAGKSTTLRAITGLLYGIPLRTQDAHVHKMTDLRIGGTLDAADGKRLRIVRRKGASNTLLDEQGAPLDDAVLLRLFRGVTVERFQHAFGLDHFTLAEGAKNLLEGKGDIGGSLFDASVGGGGDVRRLLAELEAEALEIYNPKGAKQPLSVALKTYAELTKAIKEKERLPKSYLDQEEGLTKAQAHQKKLTEERQELARKRQRIELARQRVPLERRRAAAAKTLRELETIVANAPRIAELANGLAAYEHTKKASEEDALAVERLRGQVADAARRAGKASPDLRVDARTQTRIQKLLDERAAARERLATTQGELAKSERELARLEAAPAKGASLDDASLASLRRALEGAQKLGDGESELAKRRARAQKRRAELETRAAALAPFKGTLEELAALRPPSLTALDAIAAKLAEVDKRAARTSDRIDELSRETQRIERQVAEASGAFAPPTQAELHAARARRDSLLASGQPFEAAVREADAVADRMIEAADRVLTLARHEAQRATLARQTESAKAEAEALSTEHAKLLAEHVALWHGLEPLGIAEMRAWLGKRENVLELRPAIHEEEEHAEAMAASLGAAREALASQLGSEGPLAALVDGARARLDREEALRRDAKAAADGIAQQRELLEERRASAAVHEAALADNRKKLAELLTPLGIDEEADADEVSHALGDLRELLSLTEQLAAKTERLEAQQKSTSAYEERVAVTARTLAEDLAGLGSVAIVNELASRRTQALAAQENHSSAEHSLAEMGSADLEDLPEDPQRAIDDLDASLTELDEQLHAVTQDIGGKKLGLELMRGDSGAAEIASQAQEALARVRADFDRYVRVKAAAVLLSREIEKYREENQGPLLTTASKLFARLTLGSFEGIRAGFDDKDKPALRCVRAGNVEVDVSGLSEGTRDQLYLSLRLASLLRYAEMAEPMPLVLDDVLIQFDDERSRAALSVIAEVSERVQVLFFTHHARMIELAKASVPASSLTIHELASRGASEPMTAAAPFE